MYPNDEMDRRSQDDDNRRLESGRDRRGIYDLPVGGDGTRTQRCRHQDGDIRTVAFEPGILKREGNNNRYCREVSPTIRSIMGDNRTTIMKMATCFKGNNSAKARSIGYECETSYTIGASNSGIEPTLVSYSAKPGEMIRMSEHPKIAKEICQTLTKSDGKLGDNQPTVIAFTQNTREEVRSLGDAAGALSASGGTHQSTYVCVRDGVKCFNPTQPQTKRVFDPDEAFHTLPANTGKAGQDQASILVRSNKNNTDKQDKEILQNTQGEIIMMAEVRRLTPGETSLLMGMPKDHLRVRGENTPDASVYGCNGNGWARNCSRVVFKKIHAVDGKISGAIRPFKIGSVSSGQGTHEMSVQDFGDKSMFCADIAPFPCEVLATRFPDMPNFGDVTRIDYDAEKGVLHNHKKDGYELMSDDQLGFKPVDAPDYEVSLKYGEMDCISGGLPCTSVSVAGKRHGAAEGSGTRSALAYELPRIGNACGCRWLVYENVPGLISSNGGTDLAWFLYRLQEAGYSVAWRTLDAQYTRSDMHPRAVPQRRRRIWLVGYRGDDWRVPCEALFEPMKVLGDVPPVRTVGVGYISKLQSSEKEYPVRSELDEFSEFVKGATKTIVDVLVKNGVCDSPEVRMEQLKLAARENDVKGVDNLFGFGGMDLFPQEEIHQGRGLKQKDLDLNLPEEEKIRDISQVKLWQWAKSVCQSVLFCGDMFKGLNGSDVTVDDLDPRLLENLGNAGFLSDGRIVTMKMPEWNAGVTQEELATMPAELAELYDGDVCGLSDLLEEDVDPKYQLSWRACYGILRRAVNRGKRLPIELGYALVERMVAEAAKVKWYAVYGKNTVKMEGELSERQIAKVAYDTFVEPMLPFDGVVAVAPRKDEPEEDDSVDEGEDVDDGESDPDSDEVAKIGNGEENGDGGASE